MAAETERRYEHISTDISFSSTSSNPIDRRLNFTAYFLAFIQVLEMQGEPFARIRSLCLEVVGEYVRPKNQWQKWLKRLPASLAATPLMREFFKIMNRKVSRKGHPDGFLAIVLTDKKDTFGLGYGFDILECGICKLFRKHGAEQYVSILCEVDKITSGLAGLQLIRSGTIANGAEKCDFRFKKAKKP